MNFIVNEFESLDSTSSYLKRHAAESPAGTVVCAKEQTGGRGRLGKSFLSPPGSGLYLSVLLRPESLEEALTYPFAAGIAVEEAIRETTAAEAGLKWPNDVLIHNRKVTGILAEVADQTAVILGIGINLTTPYDFFAEHQLSHVSSVLAETGVEVSIGQMRERLLSQLSSVLEWPKQQLLSCYRKRCITIGKQVHSSNGIVGICTDVSGKGELVVRDEAGEEHFLNSGEVSISGIY